MAEHGAEQGISDVLDGDVRADLAASATALDERIEQVESRPHEALAELLKGVGGAAFMGSLAVGFAIVWVLGLVARPAETHPWPLVPAALLGSIGVAAATDLPIIANVAMAGFALALVVVGIRQFSR